MPKEGNARRRLRAGAAALAALVTGAAALPAGAPAQGPTCEGRAVTLAATASQSTVYGTEGNDVIAAGPGSQRIYAGGGNDVICAGDGYDQIDGGEGDDRLFGEGQDDVLLGRGGNDFLDGGPGFDTVDAAPNAETCQGIEYAPDGHCRNVGAQDLSLPEPQAPAALGCDYWAATGGNDGAPGSFAEPYASVERLLNTLQPGEIGCLKPGVYTEPDDQINVRGHGEPGRPITLRSAPGGPFATIKGRLWVCATLPKSPCSTDPRGSHDIVFYKLAFDGRNGLAPQRGPGYGLPSPTINGDSITFLNTYVTNFSEGTCFQVGSAGYGIADDTRIQFSLIENCGIYNYNRTQAHGDQAVTLEYARNPQVVHNTIRDPSRRNSDIGIFTYDDVAGARISQNRIDGFGRAMVFGRTDDGVLSDNVVSRNIIANSVFGYYDDPYHWQVEGYTGPNAPPASNLITENCMVHPDPSRNFQPGGGGAYTVGPGNIQLTTDTCPATFGPVPFPADDILLRPEAGKNVIVARQGGAVTVKDAGSRSPAFLPLVVPAKVDLGSLVETTRGTAQVRGATSDPDATRNGSFTGALLRVVSAPATQTQVSTVPAGARVAGAGPPARTAVPGLGACRKGPTVTCCRRWWRLVPRCRRLFRTLSARTAPRYKVTSQGMDTLTLADSAFAITEIGRSSFIRVKLGRVVVRDRHTGRGRTLRAGQVYASS